MYQKVDFDDLAMNESYKINNGGFYQYGKFSGFGNPVATTLASFSELIQVYDGIQYRISLTAWFYPSCDFYRIVCEKEMKQKYREAFERRAVNQIVANLIGHGGNYY